MRHYNNLTPAEAERLAILSEEIGEVQQIIGKILRHGYENYHPNDPSVTNRDLLAVELGHFEYAKRLMLHEKDIDGEKIFGSLDAKRNSIKKYLHHQG